MFRKDLLIPALIGLGLYAENTDTNIANNTTMLLLMYVLLTDNCLVPPPPPPRFF